MNVLLNDFKAQWAIVGEDSRRAFDRVGISGWLILGEEVKAFEIELARFFGMPFATGCANGLDAIELSLKCLGLKEGEKVLTTPLTAFATTLAILRAGGSPVFVDVDDTGLMDLDLVQSALQADPSIRYLLPVHLYGHALDLEKVSKIKSKYSLTVIEDCAQAIGAKSWGKPVGSVGDLSATSFYPTKNLGCMGDGGAVLSRDLAPTEILKSLRNYGQSERYKHDLIGMNSRLDEIQAAILRSAFLPRLAQFSEIRKKIAHIYLQEINNPQLHCPPTPKGSDSVWHLFPILVSENRERFRHHLLEQGVESGIHYPVLVPHQNCLSGISESSLLSPLKMAEKFSCQEVSLPIHPFLNENQIRQVVEACNSWKP